MFQDRRFSGPQAFGVLLGQKGGNAESARRLQEDPRVAEYHLSGILGHGGGQPFLNIHDE